MSKFLNPEQIQEFKSLLKCTIIAKGETPIQEYRKAVQRYNTVFIKRAHIIVFVENESDVSITLKFVKKHKIDFAVAGGRHSYQGASSTEGLVIDLQKLNHVSVNKDAMTLTAGGGCSAEQVEVPAEEEGLYLVTGLISETGIGGFTLGGGTGMLTGQYGTGSDNLLSARVVLADGTIVNASDSENADLFWALRGCGPNFGVCTELTFRVYQNRGRVYFGMITLPPTKVRASLELALKISREEVNEYHGRYLPMLSFTLAPNSSSSASPTLLPSFVVFYDGPEEEGRKIAKPIFDLGPIIDTTGECNYTEVTQYWKKLPNMHDHPIATSATHVPATVDVRVLEMLVDGFKSIAKKYGDELPAASFGLELRSQASNTMTNVPDTAYALRQNGILANLNLIHKNVKKNKEIRADAQVLTEKVRKVLATGHSTDDGSDGVVTLANLAAPGEKVQQLWGSKFPRLQALKKKYDPNFMFNKWFPVPPQ